MKQRIASAAAMTILGGLFFFLAGGTATFGQLQRNTDHSPDQVLKSNARINPSTLAMELSIPIGGFAGRAGNGMPVTFNYSSKIWQIRYHESWDTGHGTKSDTKPNYAMRTAAGWTSSLGSPRIEYDFDIYAPFVDGETSYEGVIHTPYMGAGPGPSNFALYYVKRIQVVMSDGSSHEFRKDDNLHSYGTAHLPGGTGLPDQTGTFLSVDGSRMRLELSENESILFLPDGGRYLFGQRTLEHKAHTFIDRNGNKMTYDAANRRWTDTMGRMLSDPMPENWHPFYQSQAVGDKVASFPSISGGTLDITFGWRYLKDPNGGESGLENISDTLNNYSDVGCQGNLSHNLSGPHLFGNPEQWIARTCHPVTFNGTDWTPAPPFNPVVLTRIQLPNGQSYEFRYNVYGEITKIIYPTGSYEKFTYSFFDSVQPSEATYDQGNRGVATRLISAAGDGSDEVEWTYQAVKQYQYPYTVTITAPDGTKTQQFLHSEQPQIPRPFGFSNAITGRSFEDRVLSSSNQLLRRTLTKYTSTGPLTGGYSGATRDMRPEKEISIVFEPGDSNALATMSETVYDTTGNSDPAYFSSLNPKQSKSYHYVVVNASTAASADMTTAEGWFTIAPPATVTEVDYLYDASYKARNINGLVTETRVLNPTNTSDVLAKSQFVYDESAYFDNNYTTTNWEDPNSILRGNVTTTRTWNKDTNTWIESHTMFDNFGNVRKVWDTSGDPTRFIESEYDPVYKYAYSTKTKAPAPDPTGVHGSNEGSEISRVYDFNTGLLLSVTDANGQTAYNEYNDPLLRPTKLIPPSGGSVSEIIYNDTPGNIWVKRRQQIDEHNWAESTTFYDNLGRAFKSRTKDLQGNIESQVRFDSFGRVEKTSNPYRVDGSGNPTETIYWSKPRYDERNRVVETFAPAPEGQTGQSLGTVEFGISTLPNLIGSYFVSTDASGRKSRAISGIYGLMRIDEATGKGGTIDQDLGTLDSPTQPTYYSYNIKGEMTKITQGSQNRYFMYDSFGRLIRVRQPEQTPNTSLATTGNPENNQWTAAYSYDVFGNVISMTDAKNTTITNQYDKAGRTVKRLYSDDTPEVEFFYDGKGLPSVPQFSKGALTKVTSSVSEDRFTSFDNHGRLLQSQQITDGQTYTFGYKYNLSGGLTEQIYPSGRVVRNFLDADGGLSSTTTKAQWGLNKIVASDFDYAASGNIKKMKLGNGLWETANVDHLGQLKQIGLGTTATNKDLFKVDYEYGELNTDGTTVDANKNIGMIAKATTTIPTTSFVQTFKYDSINRLTEAVEKTGSTENWKQTFGYDRFGNRTSFSETIGGVATTNTAINHPTIDPANNRFTTGQGYIYDLNGNLIQDAEGRSFTFNGDDKQTEVRNTSTNALVGEYFYDGSGARIKKYVPSTGEVTIFVYDAGGALAAEYSTIQNPEPTTSYLTTDNLGSPRVITDEDGEVIARRDFMPFGEELGAGVGPRTQGLKYSYLGSDNVRQRFTGYEKDIETGLDFAQARMYQNRHGRFTAPDPLLASASATNPQTFNRYIYTGNNPINYTDPSGLTFCKSNSSGIISWNGEVGKPCDKDSTEVDGQEITLGERSGGQDSNGNQITPGSTVRFNADGTTQVVRTSAQNQAAAQGQSVADATANTPGQTAGDAASSAAGSSSGSSDGTANGSAGSDVIGLCLEAICPLPPQGPPRIIDIGVGVPLKTVEAIKLGAQAIQFIPGFNIPGAAIEFFINVGQGNGREAASTLPNLVPGLKWLRKGKKAAEAVDDTKRAFSTFVDVTRGKSVSNIATNSNATQAAKTLKDNGFKMSKSSDGKAFNFIKGDTKYTIRMNSKSRQGPSLDYFRNGRLKRKIRLFQQ